MKTVKKEKTSYKRYEEELLRRDNLKKEAEHWHIEYIRVFGEYIAKSFELQVECIKTKKMISYCQTYANRGEPIGSKGLNTYIETEMLDYNRELKDILNNVSAAKSAKPISSLEANQIKDIYRFLAKLMHPDLHPELAGDETVSDYWNRVVVAYEHNDLETIEELKVLVTAYLKDRYGDHGTDMELDLSEDVIVEKLNSLTKEIVTIMSTRPYTYRFILDDEEEVEEEKERFEEEITSYSRYLNDLEEILSGFDIREELLS